MHSPLNGTKSARLCAREISRGSPGLVAAVLLGLVMALFPAPVKAQDESLADVARRERERKKAQEQDAKEKEEAAKDKDGFIWVQEGNRDAKYSETSTANYWEAGGNSEEYRGEEEDAVS
jgi:hypothetical protein